jgi:hypothetical protein
MGSANVSAPEMQHVVALKDVVGRRLCDRDGQPPGPVTALYRYLPELDASGGAAAVTKGRIVRSTHLVDLRDTSFDGDTVVAAHPIALISAAPNYQALVGDILSDRHAAEVLKHYGRRIGRRSAKGLR